jgi:hypothetical protein
MILPCLNHNEIERGEEVGDVDVSELGGRSTELWGEEKNNK